jgi:hypothetical protein
MKARTKPILVTGIRSSWSNHSPIVVYGGLIGNHSATVVRAA